MKNIYLLIASFLLLTACKKDDKTEPWFSPPEVTELPPETQTGANTFGCYINGEPWVPYGGNAFDVDIVNDTILYINAKRKYSGHYTSFAFELLNFKITPDSYQLAYDDQFVSVRHVNSSEGNDVKVYRVTSTCDGLLTITRHDTVARIISGRFYFTAIEEHGDTVWVTDGRFDNRY